MNLGVLNQRHEHELIGEILSVLVATGTFGVGTEIGCGRVGVLFVGGSLDFWLMGVLLTLSELYCFAGVELDSA